MKKILFPCLFALLASCDDGDLQIETLDFDKITTVQFCDTPETTSTNLVLFKIDGDEALILTLQDGLLKNEASTETITSTIPGQSQLTYRIFSNTVPKDYFCSTVPLTEPTVISNIDATAGNVIITTTQKEDGSFEHKIQLSAITLETSENQRITDLSINDFGTITTSN